MIQKEIVDTLEAIAQDWRNGNYSGLKSYWDRTDPQPIYIAEENDKVMTSWPEVDAYFQGTENWNEKIDVRYSNYQVKHVDEHHAMATFDLHFDIKLNDRPNPIGGDNRVVVSFRKADDQWKLYAWVEAPLAPITYIRKLYEMNVSKEFSDG
ncbi:MAG: hypothetical protein Hens3KO_23610 [Henriciella sp.]